jgi:hypothetical protein
MANRLYSPDQQFADQNGIPYAGGFLYFYASGTSTPLTTYQDSALSIPNTNPVVLDSAGRAGSIFLQNLAYKVVLTDVNSNQIWTEDPVYSSDYSTTAQFAVYAGNPNGNLAGTAGTGQVPSSVIWDTVTNVLYVCTTTGTVSTAVWTAVNASTPAGVIPPPQGYLTPTSGTPIITQDTTGVSAILYTPYVGNIIPIYNGSSFVPTVFSEMTCTLTSSNQSASTLYDVFVFSNSGVLTLVCGPAWGTNTPGSCARGTGAGTTQLQRINGLWVNAVQITGTNSTNSYTIKANQATFVGTISIDATAGQISFYRSYGQSRKWAASNAYNRVPIILQGGDGTATWTYGTNTWRPSNNSTANSITTFDCLGEEGINIQFYSSPQLASQVPVNGIGWNSTTAPSGFLAIPAELSSQATGVTAVASLQEAPSLGLNTATCLEKVVSGGNTTFQGTNTYMLLTATWMG